MPKLTITNAKAKQLYVAHSKFKRHVHPTVGRTAKIENSELEMKDEDLVLQLSKYAELIQKLRNFHEKHILNVTAMLNEGNEKIAKSLLMQLCQRLYSSGAPLWVLQPVMGRVAKGLLGGKDGIEFVLYSKEGFGKKDITQAFI